MQRLSWRKIKSKSKKALNYTFHFTFYVLLFTHVSRLSLHQTELALYGIAIEIDLSNMATPALVIPHS
jgi:hypothetical protein